MKKHKIIDCVFFYDEIEMLLFRMTELDEYVDYFIVMESENDFIGNPKPLFFIENSDIFEKWKDKIVHISSPSLTLEENNNFQIYLRKNNLVSGPLIDSINRTSTQEYLLDKLYKFLLKSDFYLEDIIMISNVDEIPDLSQYDEIIDKLKFGPVVCRQKNFCWSTEYINTLHHYGTSFILFTELITSPRNLFRSYFNKNSNILQVFELIDGGYHFSHFYDIEKTKKKIKLLSNDDDLKIDSHVINCWNNLLSLKTDESGRTYPLIEYNDVLPKNISLLENQNIGRDKIKKHFVSINSNIDVVEQYFEKFGDTVSMVNFTSDPKVTNKVILSDKIIQYNLLIPNSKYYDLFIGENTLENFQKMYGINEIKKILQDKFPLDKDLFVFFNGEKPGTLLGVSWKDLKDKFLYDKISEIL
jgi:hypothetical protein